MKHDKKPLIKIFFQSRLNFLLIKKPNKKDPMIEIIRLWSINNLKKVAIKQARRILIKFFIFTLNNIESENYLNKIK